MPDFACELADEELNIATPKSEQSSPVRFYWITDLASMLSDSRVPLVLAPVLLLLLVGLPLRASALSKAQEEAYYQVDVLLSTEPQDESDKGIAASIKSAKELLQLTLADIQEGPIAESSISGEVRGETIDLLRKLISLHEMVKRKEKKEVIYAISEDIGTNLVGVWQSEERRLTHLENHLARLVSLIEEKSDKPEKNWFSRFLEKLGF